MPTRRSRLANRRVAVLVYDGLCAFEFALAAEVFALPRPEVGPDWYHFETCAATRRPLRSQYGLALRADAGLAQLASAGTVVVPGWSGIDTRVPASVIEALRDAHARGARLLSICSGAFVLAAAGLLDGRRATTHWRYAPLLQERHPAIRVDANVLYVDEGNVLTSAGSAAGLDLCLHVVRRDFGPDVANQVARRLVVPPHRDGGQAQFLQRPVARRERDLLAPVLDAMQRALSRPLPIADLAAMAAMSERTFLRRFRDATGTTPGDWLIGLRVDRARELLETGTASVESIAEQTGLGTATTLRHHFRRRLGISPGSYRKRFSREDAAPPRGLHAARPAGAG